MAEQQISVILVDDHSLVRRGFRRMLEDEPDINVVGEASDGEEAVKLALALRPNVVVMDCALPGINGLQATRKILQHLPKTLVLMLSMHTEDTWVRQALEAGARGYVLSGGWPIVPARKLEGRAECRAYAAGSRNPAADLRWKIEQGNRGAA